MKKHLILNTALLIVGALAFLVTMPFINFQEFNDTAFAMTNADCDKCHSVYPNRSGNYFITKDKHHLYYRVQYDDACTMCHYLPSYDIANCVGCHTSGSVCDSTLSDHSDCKLVAHNNASLDSTDCSSCHATNVVTEHDKYNTKNLDAINKKYNFICGLCHYVPDNSKTPPQYYSGNISQNVKDAAITKGSGVSGQTVYCTSCHVTTNHLAQHDHAKIDSETCTQCHNSNVVTEHANRNLGCAVCHSSTDANVLAVIDKGKGPTGKDVFCYDCHGTITDHKADHDKTSLPTGNCSDCHVANVVTEHVEKHSLACNVCHNQTYQWVIDKGKGSTGQIVYCSDCHGTITDHKADHDKTSLPTGNCSDCHVANVVTEHVEKHSLACNVCHNQTYKSVIDYGSGPTGQTVYCSDCHGTVDHTAAHDKAVIPYADCGSCHVTNVVTEHANHNVTCAQCHNTTYQQVIATGKSGTLVYCATCHASFGNHVKQHDKTFIAAGDCFSYATNVVTYHESISTPTNGIYCIKCHTYPSDTVLTAINDGMAGKSVWCGNCHTLMCLPNQSPVANAGSDQTVQVGQSVSFNGSASYDPDGTITSYAWDFGDGSTGTGVTTSHTYTTAVTYTVTLTVTDNNGATGTDTAIVTVTSLANTNLALNKSTSASGSESGYGPSNAVDGNMTTRWWKKSTSEQWIRVDLGSSMSISKVILKWYSYYAKDYYIETSTDRSNWSNVKSVSGSDGGTDENTFSSKTARYVRVRCKAAYNYNGYSLYEFEVYK